MLTKIKLCRQSSAQLPRIEFHDNPFGDSRVLAFRVDGRTADQLVIRAYISKQMLKQLRGRPGAEVHVWEVSNSNLILKPILRLTFPSWFSLFFPLVRFYPDVLFIIRPIILKTLVLRYVFSLGETGH
jgi:hypothetical protein